MIFLSLKERRYSDFFSLVGSLIIMEYEGKASSSKS